jgi:hypothetical protein
MENSDSFGHTSGPTPQQAGAAKRAREEDLRTGLPVCSFTHLYARNVTSGASSR